MTWESETRQLEPVDFLIVTLLAVVLAVSAIPGLYGGSASPSTAAAWARLVLGARLVVVAVKSWRSRPGPGEVPEPPAWLERAETLGPARSFVLGAALGWLRYGRKLIPFRYLLLTPLYIAWKIPLYLAFLIGRREREWQRTERG